MAQVPEFLKSLLTGGFAEGVARSESARGRGRQEGQLKAEEARQAQISQTILDSLNQTDIDVARQGQRNKAQDRAQAAAEEAAEAATARQLFPELAGVEDDNEVRARFRVMREDMVTQQAQADRVALTEARGGVAEAAALRTRQGQVDRADTVAGRARARADAAAGRSREAATLAFERSQEAATLSERRSDVDAAMAATGAMLNDTSLRFGPEELLAMAEAEAVRLGFPGGLKQLEAEAQGVTPEQQSWDEVAAQLGSAEAATAAIGPRPTG